MIHRRSFITGLVSLVAAPAIVRAGSLMPVKLMIEPVCEGMTIEKIIAAKRIFLQWNDVARYVIGDEIVYSDERFRAIR